jgi:predicted ribosome quality control (RQC) complex YloA/Tae2 family protein
VIVRPPPGKDAAPEALGDAAQLAVFYSLGRDAGAHDVDYTHVKHVRIMGKETGRFTMADRRTLRVTLQEDRLQAILESVDVA